MRPYLVPTRASEAFQGRSPCFHIGIEISVAFRSILHTRESTSPKCTSVFGKCTFNAELSSPKIALVFGNALLMMIIEPTCSTCWFRKAVITIISGIHPKNVENVQFITHKSLGFAHFRICPNWFLVATGHAAATYCTVRPRCYCRPWANLNLTSLAPRSVCLRGRGRSLPVPTAGRPDWRRLPRAAPSTGPLSVPRPLLLSRWQWREPVGT
jgi:hypothetical protein